jgi:hypothetical protein
MKFEVHFNRRLRDMAVLEVEAGENMYAWDGNSKRRLFSVVRLQFTHFAKNIIADLLVIFRHVRKIAESDY